MAQVPIGGLLALPSTEIDVVLRHQQQSGRLFGETAVDLGFATQLQVRQAIQQQQNFTVLAREDARVSPLVAAAFDPEAGISQSVRALRGAIGSFRGSVGVAPVLLSILSVDAPTEASLIAANLAVTCAQAGRQTLLVDANLNMPSQDGLFFLSNRIGLSTWLTGDQDNEPTIRSSAVPLLSVLPTGPAIPNGAELFERAGLINRLHALSDRYDQIVVDAGRAGRGSSSLSTGFDAALIVVRRDVSSPVELKGMIAELEAAEVPVLGTIFSE